MSLRDDIRTLRGYNQFAIRKNLEGVTQAESLKQPAPGGNCLNWVLGHLLFHRNPMLVPLGEEPVMTPDDAEPYVRGSTPLSDPTQALSLERLLDGLETSHDTIDAALERTTDEALAAPVEPGSQTTIGTRLLSLQFHEAYHAGQLGILRRLAGHEPALK